LRRLRRRAAAAEACEEVEVAATAAAAEAASAAAAFSSSSCRFSMRGFEDVVASSSLASAEEVSFSPAGDRTRVPVVASILAAPLRPFPATTCRAGRPPQRPSCPHPQTKRHSPGRPPPPAAGTVPLPTPRKDPLSPRNATAQKRNPAARKSITRRPQFSPAPPVEPPGDSLRVLARRGSSCAASWLQHKRRGQKEGILCLPSKKEHRHTRSPE